MIRIQLPLRYRRVISLSEVERIASYILRSLAHSNDEISIIFTNNAMIQKYNKKYRGLDQPTDVLSFNMNEYIPNSNQALLGDIVISIEQAKIQSKTNHTDYLSEIYLLLIHGILHLLGFDHDTKQKQKVMWTLQDRLLMELEIPIQSPVY